jgi:hypothetical protein
VCNRIQPIGRAAIQALDAPSAISFSCLSITFTSRELYLSLWRCRVDVHVRYALDAIEKNEVGGIDSYRPMTNFGAPPPSHPHCSGKMP